MNLKYNGIHSIIFDSRGVIVNCENGNIFDHSQELDKTMLNFKQFVGIVRSTIPLVEKEREALKFALPLVDEYLGGLSDEEFQALFQYPNEFFNDNPSPVITCFGHVISFGPFTLPFIFNSHNFEEFFSSFKQLTHLQSLNCVINNYDNDNTQILDEFGNVFWI